MSPFASPAYDAAVPGGGSPTTGFNPGMPAMKSAQYTTNARRKFANGPAITMKMRDHTPWRLNARGKSSLATVPSRSSAIFTYPPSGIDASTHSVWSGPRRRTASGLPNPTEKRRIFTPAQRAAR